MKYRKSFPQRVVDYVWFYYWATYTGAKIGFGSPRPLRRVPGVFLRGMRRWAGEDMGEEIMKEIRSELQFRRITQEHSHPRG